MVTRRTVRPANFEPNVEFGGPVSAQNAAINKLLMRVARRAEKSTPEYLTHTFVPVDPVPALLDCPDNQVLYGRRGTGKTHLLKYLAQRKNEADDVAVYNDLRTVGSSGGLYADKTQSVALRATHLLVDVIEHLHAQLLDLILEGQRFDDLLDRLVPGLDAIAEAATQVEVVGSVERVRETEDADEAGSASDLSVGFTGTKPSASGRRTRKATTTRRIKEETRTAGAEALTVKFGPLGRALSELSGGA
jgi:hypothetical protein